MLRILVLYPLRSIASKYTLWVVISLTLVQVASGQGGPMPRVPPNQPTSYMSNKRKNSDVSPCDLALDACLSTVKAQDNLIVQLKDNNQKLADSLATASKPAILPTWAWVVLGVAVGVAAGSAIRR